MRNYAIRSTLGSTESPAKESIAIIDGPGLAHYVFYQLCDKRNSSAQDLSYAACADAAIKWLKDLQSIGFKVETILFDGALPDSKKDVRIGRLQSYTDRLLAYKQALGNAAPRLSGQARKSLSPPPFLVFAIVEELLHHTDFSDVTFMVPGEADPYCVAAAQVAEGDSPIAIFSDDADLLVYRLGQRTSVIPFRDLSVSREASNTIWTGEQYRSSEIAKRFSTDDLIKPAYFMAQDPFLALEKACDMVKSTDPCKKPDFASFEKTFQTTEEVARWGSIRTSSRSSKDSRVAELLDQLQHKDDGCLRMYLPFLLDDPSKKTAWTIGTDLHAMAYSCLLHQSGADTGVQEYRRSGSRIVSTMVEPLSKAEASKQMEHLTSHIGQVLTWARDSHDLTRADAWRYLILQHTLHSIQSGGHLLPSVDDSVSIVTNGEHAQWHLIHFSAQYQAAFYSFRMLKQITDHIVTQDPQDAEGLAALEKLRQELETLPRISALFTASEVEQHVWHLMVRNLLSTLIESNEDEEQRPRKKAKKSKKSKQAQSAVLEKNPFAMLADD